MPENSLKRLVNALRQTTNNWMRIQMPDCEFWPQLPEIRCLFCGAKYTVPTYGLTSYEIAHQFGAFVEHDRNCPLTVLQEAIDVPPMRSVASIS